MKDICSPRACIMPNLGIAVDSTRYSIAQTANVSEVVDSNSAANQLWRTRVGYCGIIASATDADAADTVTYELSNDAGGLFKINGDGG